MLDRVEGSAVAPVSSGQPDGPKTTSRLLIVTASAFLLLLTTGFWYSQAWTDRPAQPHSESAADLYRYYLPGSVYLAETLRQGRLPLWNPYEFAGMPFLATLEVGPLYPPNAVALCFEPDTAHLLSGLLHLLLLAGSMFLYLRKSLGLHNLPSVLGACAIGLTGWTLFHMLASPDTFRSAAYLPLVLWLTDRLITRPGFGRVAALGIALALQFLAGEVEISARTGLILVPYVLMRLWPHARRGPGMRDATGRLGAVAAAGLLALALAAAQLLPFYEASLQSPRPPGGLTYEQTRAGAPPFADLVRFATTPDADGMVYFVGAIPLVLALYSLRRHRAETWFFLLLGIIVAALLQRDWPWISKLFYLLPTGSWFRAPIRFLPFLFLAVATLAALGLDALLDDMTIGGNRRRRIGALAFLVTATVAAGIAAPSDPSFALTGLAIMAVSAGLAVIGRRWAAPLIPVAALAAVLYVPWMVFSGHEFNVPRQLDLVGLDPSVRQAVTSSLSPADRIYVDATLSDGRRVPAIGLLTNVPAITGFSPFIPKSYEGFLRPYRADRLQRADSAVPRDQWPPAVSVMGGLSLENGAQQALDILGVRHVAKGLGSDLGQADGSSSPLDPKSQLGGITVYENGSRWPRAFVVTGEPQTVEALVQAYRAGSTPADVTAYSPERVRIALDPSLRGTLVLTDQHYPGWQAVADGKPVPIHLIAGLFRGVKVGGTTEIEFHYRPRSFYAGATISLLTLTILVAAATQRLRRKRRARSKRV